MYVIVVHIGKGDASGDNTEIYGPFFNLETAHKWGHEQITLRYPADESGWWHIYQVHEAKEGNG